MCPIRLFEPSSPATTPNPTSPPPTQRPGESKSQTINRLAAELNVARMAKTHAERKARELEDVMRQREQLMDISTQQCEAAWDAMAELKQQLAAQDTVGKLVLLSPLSPPSPARSCSLTTSVRPKQVIKRLKQDAKDFPLSTPALMRSHQLLNATFETLRECFTCPLCYEALAKTDAVSLRCGHTFCKSCVDAWAESSAMTDPRLVHQKPTPGAEAVVPCPECRTTGSARVRLYMLEEAIRLLARAERERESVESEELARRTQLEVVVDPKPSDYLTD